ncbi:hypothetical protein [Kitasatospora sp. NPDC093806]|uniref:hypothetical protein n=1 Tax=Kitasatospora sp. NPDC093806 TaxID=3155075 RepID=UPI003432E7D9
MPSGASPAWRPGAALSREQLTAALVPVAELAPDTTTEDPGATPAARASASASASGEAACAPVLAVLSEQPQASARRWYVSGNNVLGNRTLVDAAGLPEGRSRERFEALKDAVYGGGCTAFRPEGGTGGARLRVEAVPSEVTEAPAVGFRILSPTGAVNGAGGFTRVYLYAAVGDNRVLFLKGDDTAHAPALPADLVTAQIHRLVTATSG